MANEERVTTTFNNVYDDSIVVGIKLGATICESVVLKNDTIGGQVKLEVKPGPEVCGPCYFALQGFCKEKATDSDKV